MNEGSKVKDSDGRKEGIIVGVRSQVAQQYVQHSQTTSFDTPSQSACNVVMPHKGTVPVN